MKFVARCEVCGDPINKEEMEDHIRDSHKLTDCGDCGKKLERRLFSSHKKKCQEKPSICSFCELTLPKSELHEHEYMCGSKTEICHVCGQSITIRGSYL